jgi:ferritin-like metal-binding protein YciE
MADPTAANAKLIQYLNEAYGKEKQLETALQAHISMTTRESYRKRLQQHLTETKSHARAVEQRIKALGGSAGSLIDIAQEAANRGAALAQGPLHMVRGTGEQEKLLRNARTEYSDEAEEIASYTAIEALAEMVGDDETAKLARAIRRDEEQMARFLERLIPTLTKAVARDEVPASQRQTGGARRASRAGGRQRGGGSRAGGRQRRGSRAGGRRRQASRAGGRGRGS